MATADDDFDIYDSDLLAPVTTEDSDEQQSFNQSGRDSKDSTPGGGTPDKSKGEGMGDDEVFAEFAEYSQGSKDGLNGSGMESKVIPLDPGATVALTVTELQWWTSEEDLREMAKEVQQDQAVKEIAFSEHKGNGKSRGIAFMLFSSATSAQAVKRHLESKTIGEKSVQAIFTHQTTNPYKTGPKDTKRSYPHQTGGMDVGNASPGVGVPNASQAHIMRYPGLPFNGPPAMSFPMNPGAMPQQPQQHQPPMNWRGGHMARGGRGGFRGGGRGGMGQPGPPYGSLAGAAFNPAFFDPTSAAAMASMSSGGHPQGFSHNNQGRGFHSRGGGGRGGGAPRHHPGQGMGQRHSEDG
ncbi:MAG: hypothetical protein DHS80DRAFT_31347 [Piptocephalis tieghemiana]|nr:MAG: hypothetical protein DHS80DRAFT_31347 [Piptocephalis tieghemiana]